MKALDYPVDTGLPKKLIKAEVINGFKKGSDKVMNNWSFNRTGRNLPRNTPNIFAHCRNTQLKENMARLTWSS